MATYNSFVHAQAIIRDLFSSARSFHWTHDELLNQRDKRLYSLPGYTGSKHQGFTRYERGFLDGMWKTLSDSLWSELVWAFNVAPAGEPDLYPVLYQDATPAQLELIHKESDTRGHHYWPERNGSGVSNDRF